MPKHIVGVERTLLRALGERLKAGRTERGWTREGLVARAGFDVCVQTIACYELGTRRCTVSRLIDLCDVLSLDPVTVLGEALAETGLSASADGTFAIDLTEVVKVKGTNLAPLRGWATTRLRESQSSRARLSMTALENLADLCRTDPMDLYRDLRESGCMVSVTV